MRQVTPPSHHAFLLSNDTGIMNKVSVCSKVFNKILNLDKIEGIPAIPSYSYKKAILRNPTIQGEKSRYRTAQHIPLAKYCTEAASIQGLICLDESSMNHLKPRTDQVVWGWIKWFKGRCRRFTLNWPRLLSNWAICLGTTWEWVKGWLSFFTIWRWKWDKGWLLQGFHTGTSNLQPFLY